MSVFNFKEQCPRVIHGDCREVLLNEFEDNSIDLVITDPPYNAGKGFPNDNMSRGDFLNFTRDWMYAVERKLSTNGSFYCFINEEYLCDFKQMFDSYLMFRRLITWHFEGFFNKFKDNYDNRSEYVLFYTKSNDYTFNIIKEKPSKSLVKRWGPCADEDGNVPYDKLTPSMQKRQPRKNYNKNPINVRRGLYQGNVIKCHRPRYRKHISQKPEKLIEIFMLASSNPGDLVLDLDSVEIWEISNRLEEGCNDYKKCKISKNKQTRREEK